MTTWVGSSTDKIIVADHATLASATYAWGIVGKAKDNDAMGWLKGTRQNQNANISIGKKGYIMDYSWTISEVSISNWTDYQNFKKMVSAWEKANTLLYLWVKNEWGENLAIHGSYANPTTLSQHTGKIEGLAGEVRAAEYVCGFKMPYIYKA